MSSWLLGDATGLHASVAPSLRPPTLTAANAMNQYAFGQQADGHWQTIGGVTWSPWANVGLDTTNAILVLTKSVTKPLPVAVLAAVLDQSARNPQPFTLNGSASYHQDTAASIVEWLYMMDAPASPDWSGNTAGYPVYSGITTSANPGWNTVATHTVTLRVKDNQTPANYATTTTTVKVTLADVPPVALPMPPTRVPQIYTGNLGDTIVLDGTASFDVDGDPIVSYAWDLNGDGLYGTAADIALDTSGQGAVGSTASVVYTIAHTGQIGLKVCSQPRDVHGNPVGSPVCASSTKPVDVYGTASDLYVSSLTATNLNPTVPVTSAPGWRAPSAVPLSPTWVFVSTTAIRSRAASSSAATIW